MKSNNPCPVCGCRSKWYYFTVELVTEELLEPSTIQELLIVEYHLPNEDDELWDHDYCKVWDHDYCKGCDTIFTGTL